MYRRMYGLPKNHGLVFAVSPRPYTSPTKPTNRPVQPKSLTTLLNSSDSSTSVSGPKKYRCCNRRRPPAAFRDSAVWAKLLDEENLGKLRELEVEREKAEPAPLAEETEIECLLVKDIQLHIKENAESHHTDLFESTDRDLDPQLVVRRGQEFKLTLTFQRPWSSKDDDMNLIFKIGDAPNPNKGTFVSIKLEEGKETSYMTSESKEWGARILEQTGNTLTLGVYPPPDVIVGEWEYAVRTVKVKDEEVEEYDCEGSEEVIILLNPWCKDDDVYMENSDELKEYISNQIGLVFCGSYHSIQSKPWFYDQFLEGMLEASLHLLRKANDFTITSKMGDPVYIARALSRISLNTCVHCRVGKKISTKWPNGTAVTYYNGVDEGNRLDVTDLYKYPEGSVAEREVVEKATRAGSLGYFLFKNESGVQISIDDLEQLLRVGQDVTVKVTVKNVTSEPRSLSLRTTVRPINYWGGLRGKERVASQVYDEDTLQPDEYELVIKTPGIRCTAASEKVSVQEPVEVEMTLKNPLATEKLTRCQLKIQGTVEVDDQRFTKKHACYTANLDDLQPGEVRSVKVKVKPTRLPTKSQEREMNVGLVTRELPDFVGNLHFEL
ncbi:hemocyte protein-glutamine gamma-glutamyltransferase [Plakobranchus ocellatus]|uniref:Hemocyte protein-glutamine gamma-glutamyltransferase n=1 Tax=Plakobranchus ocellatus TaxID=259542 RepID=A0AAV4CS85_9GAST|nr:hemocyte protein-glutamine gamma-glutamyltransferase [Plakobranchus ocellatus]